MHYLDTNGSGDFLSVPGHLCVSSGPLCNKNFHDGECGGFNPSEGGEEWG